MSDHPSLPGPELMHTNDGRAVWEVITLLRSIGDAEYVRDGVLGYLRSRYREPTWILTEKDLEGLQAPKGS